jgi:23S rRNA pseudouridine2605 synthase
MPRDTDKHNDSPRGRREGPAGGKGRSGKPRGPEKKFAKRGFAPKRGEADGDKPRFKRDDRPRGDRPFRERPARDGDGEKRSFKPRGDRPFRDRPARDGDGEKRPFKPRGDRPFRDRPARDGDGEKRSFKPRGDRPFRDRPARDGDGDKRSFKPRGDRPFRDRPARDGDGERRPFKPRGDKPRFDRDDRPPRRDRDEARPAGRFQDRKFRDRDGEREFKARDRSSEKPWQKREDRGGGDDRPRFSRPREDREQGDRPFRDRPKFDRPREDRGDRPKFARGDRPKFERPGEDRPKFSRPRRDRESGPRERDGESAERRSDRPKFDRPKFDRPHRDRKSGPGETRERRPRPEGRMDWQEHPRSERGDSDGFADRPRRENEDDSQIFAKRPAFGGRGAYRERPDFEKRPRPEPKAKKTGERIAKVLARAGLASRRDAEEMVTAGRVTVNGRLINSPALDITANDVVAVDGKPLPPRERTRLFLYHKPKGLMTTHDDPEGRPTVFDNLPEGLPRLISIGRLDFNTEGLLLLTNDGGLARLLELPDTGWLRRYRVRAHGEITQAQLDELKNGIEVEGVKYGPIDATLERDQGANVWLVFAIREGKNREVRNVMAHLGLEVNRLIRISYGPFQLGEVEEGQVDEVKTRVLREQLGEKVIAQAGCEFERGEKREADDDDAPRGKKPFKPSGKSALVSDRKGRRVLVQRSGSAEARARNEDESAGYGPPRRPKRGYHGKRDLTPRDE